jgi:hypothetical protein
MEKAFQKGEVGGEERGSGFEDGLRLDRSKRGMECWIMGYWEMEYSVVSCGVLELQGAYEGSRDGGILIAASEGFTI